MELDEITAVLQKEQFVETPNLMNTSKESVKQIAEEALGSTLYHNETVHSIETELKQLISTKVDEKISSISLCNEGNCLESVHSFLIQEIHNAAYYNQNLLKQIDSDTLALSRSKQLVSNLFDHCEKIKLAYKSLQNKIDSLKNYNRLQLYKEQFDEIANLEEDYKVKIKEKEQGIRNELEGLVEKLKKRQESLKKIKENGFIEIEKKCSDLDLKAIELEKAKLNLVNELKTSENESYKEAHAAVLAKQEEKIARLESEKLKQIELLNSLTLTRDELKSEQEKDRALLYENSKITASNLIEEIKKKSERLTTLEDQLREFQQLKEIEANEMKVEYKKLRAISQEKQAKLLEAKLKTQKMKEDLEKRKSDFMNLSEHRSALIKSLEDRKNQTHSLEMDLSEKKTSIAALQEKFQLLQVKESQLTESIAKIDEEILQESERHERSTAENNAKLEELQNKQKSLNEMARSKEYLVLSNQYLKEKLEDLQKEFDKSAQRTATQEEERVNLLKLIDTKQKTFNDLKLKLDAMQKKTDPVKSLLKPTGKERTAGKSVKFNDLLSFKSITESESSQGDLSQSKSLQDWFNNLK